MWATERAAPPADHLSALATFVPWYNVAVTTGRHSRHPCYETPLTTKSPSSFVSMCLSHPNHSTFVHSVSTPTCQTWTAAPLKFSNPHKIPLDTTIFATHPIFLTHHLPSRSSQSVFSSLDRRHYSSTSTYYLSKQDTQLITSKRGLFWALASLQFRCNRCCS
jgi:hypothetical protein